MVYTIHVVYFSNEKQKFVKREFLVMADNEDVARGRVFTWMVNKLGFPINIREMTVAVA
jgi:hypothetical protein